jgi:sulfur carrier protein ThiS
MDEPEPNPNQQLTNPQKSKVVLCRAGLEPKLYEVPQGTTVGDLLREAGTQINNNILTINRDRVTDQRVLANGEFLFVVPAPKNA